MADPKIKEFGAVDQLPPTRKKAVVKPGPGQPRQEPEGEPATYETKVVVPNTMNIKSLEDESKSSD